MKKYEKPMLTVLSLCGNDQLCGSCADNNADVLLSQNPSGVEAQIIDDAVNHGSGDGVLTREEAATLFANGGECKTGLETYCKFTSTMVVAWS